MQITTKCCGLENPVGITTPYFSWILKECTDAKQLSYRIGVYSENTLIWDSGMVTSDKSVYVKYEGIPLKENTKYTWDVTITTENSKYVSEKAYFITGIYNTSALSWISANSSINSPVIHKEFNLDEIADYVTLNICGLGFFEACINGKKVSTDILCPVRTDYDTVKYLNLKYPFDNVTKKSVKYLSYEISDMLVRGKNKISIWLGNGWYKQRGRKTEGTLDYGENLKMFFRITSGNTIIESDTACYATNSPLIYDNVFYGEIYDSRVTPTTSQVFNITPPEARIEPHLCPSDRIRYSLTPCFKNDIYDAGICMTGFAEIDISGNSGDKIEVYYAEDINGSELDFTSTVGYEEGDKNQIQKDTYILNGSGNETYTPHFTWHAFRYFKIVTTGNITVNSVKAHFVSTDLRQRTSFKSSSELLNNIHNAALNSQLSNAHGGVLSDCPGREKLGYTGDGNLASLSVMYNFDAYHFYAKWLDDILDAQNLKTGFVPHTAPFNGGGGGPAWGSAIAVVPWNHFMQYGDIQVLKKAEPHIKKWIDYLTTRLENGLVTHEEDGSWCLGDWCMPSKYPWSEPHPDEIRIPNELVNTVYYIYCIDIYNQIAKVLDMAPYAASQREFSVDAVNKYLNNNYYSSGEQGCNLFPLFVGIVPENNEKAVFDNTIEGIKNSNYHMQTGILGTAFLFRVLDQYKRNDIALKIFLNEEYPGFGYMIKQGATSFWETWEGTGAKNHMGFLSADSWFFYGLAGIKPVAGYKEFSITPYFAEELDFLNVSLECEYGTISLQWIRRKNGIEVELSIPFNTTAHINLNGKCMKLNSGTYKELIS